MLSLPPKTTLSTERIIPEYKGKLEETIPSQTEQVPLFQSMLPNNKEEGQTLKTIIGTPKDWKDNPSDKSIASVVYLILQIALETSKAIEESNYKKFDALIRNFGCHLTACYVQQTVGDPQLRQQALKVKKVAEDKLQQFELLSQQNSSKNAKWSDILDFTVSPEMCNLMRFRLLCIVNTNIEKKGKEGREFPCSVMRPLLERITEFNYPANSSKKVEELSEETKIIEKRIKKIFLDRPLKEFSSTELTQETLNTRHLSSKLLEQDIDPDKMINILDLFLRGVHVEESAKAALYIRDVASKLQQKEPRTELIQRMLSKEFECKSLGISSLPLMYNTEAVIKSLKERVVLLKNKLYFCGKRIEGAKPLKVFFKMPEERILSQEDVDRLPKDEPIMVFEGNLSEDKPLAKLIPKMGFVAIINAINALLPQYANQASIKLAKMKLLTDKEAQYDLDKFKKRTDAASVIDFLDHIYCASVMEET